MINFVIFGSNGFIATSFIENIKESNNLILISRKQSVSKENINFKEINFDLSKNKCNEEINYLCNKIKKYLTKNKTIFLLFAWSGKSTRADLLKSKEICLENKNMLKNYLEILEKINPEKNIFISSAGGIYQQNNLIPSKENDTPKPYSNYGFEKLYAENYLQNHYNKKLLILRISSVYGCRNNLGSQGVISNWIIKCLTCKPLAIYNSLDSKINFISITQVCQAILLSIKFDLQGIYNIGSHESTSLFKIIEKLKDVHKSEINFRYQGEINKRLFFLDTDLFTQSTKKIFYSNCINEIKNMYEYYKSRL